MKKLSTLALTIALALSTTVASFAATTGNVIVTWNATATAALTLQTNYTGTGLNWSTGNSIFTNAQTGAGTCSAAAPTTVNLTLDFGTIAPDLAQNTDCLYKNAINAQVQTNSTTWTLQAKLSAAGPTGYSFCQVPNNGASYPLTAAQVAALTAASAQSARTDASSFTSPGATCPTGSLTLTTANQNMVTNGATAYTTAPGADVGSDFGIIASTTAATGTGKTVTVVYTVIP